ncbi:hypothetical protein [Streptomyces cinnamoneus]|nr:hypothetical protein [Streptomyces cinnamoneus]
MPARARRRGGEQLLDALPLRRLRPAADVVGPPKVAAHPDSKG